MSERRFRIGGHEFAVDATRDGNELRLVAQGQPERRFPLQRVGTAEFVLRDPDQEGVLHSFYAIHDGKHWWVHLDGRTWHLEAVLSHGRSDRSGAGLTAPIPATVTEVLVRDGDQVEAGQVLMILSAMKMQLEIKAPHAGIVSGVLFSPGDQVDGGVALLAVTEAAD